MAENTRETMTESGGELSPRDFWEQRYGNEKQVWSGRVNAVLADIATGLAPGRALDLGCGEGGDALWLAQHGWQVTGIDISQTAIERAQLAARALAQGDDRIRFIAADLSTFSTDDEYELVTASFLQSPVALDRVGVVRRAAANVVKGGHLLITSHGPPGSGTQHGHAAHYVFQTPAEERETLALDPESWAIVIAELRPRATHAADGTVATLDDSVLLLRRR